MENFGTYVIYLMNQSSDLSTYQIEGEPFGNGEFSTNYKAKDRRKQKYFIIKKIKSDLVKTEEEQNLLMRENYLQASFHHASILELVGITIPFQDQKYYALITPFMPNGDLKNLIEQVSIGNAPENWETLKSINMIGIAAGMAYMHQKNFIHQDLRPEHIVLDENNFPKIIGFHCSKLYKSKKQPLPIYSAPELLENSNYSNKIDIFSYGMLIYYLLSLEVPWSHIEGIDSHELSKFVSEGKRPELRDKEIPNGTKKLIEMCWSNDPNDRPSFSQIVKMITENKEDFFDLSLVDEEQLCDYIELITTCLPI